jgi:thiol:disulfide interchange protein DsbD
MTAFLPRHLAPLLLVVQGFCVTAAVAADDFLAPEQAFRFEARAVDAHHVEVVFNVADGYYLYRERFAFAANPATVKLGAPAIPPGKIKYDETFGKKLETHRGRVVIRVPVESAPAAFTLTVTSQGCADAGLCYAPMQSTVQLSPANASRNPSR